MYSITLYIYMVLYLKQDVWETFSIIQEVVPTSKKGRKVKHTSENS